MQMFMSMYAGKSVCEWLRMGIRMGIGALSARWWGSERSRSLSCSPPWNMQMIIWCIIHWRNVLQASSRSSPLSFNWLRWDCVKKKKGMIGPIRLLAAYFSIRIPSSSSSWNQLRSCRLRVNPNRRRDFHSGKNWSRRDLLCRHAQRKADEN